MKERYGEITKQILLTVGIAGVIILAASAPGVLQVAKLVSLDRNNRFKKPKSTRVAQSIQGLQKNKLLTLKERNGRIEIRLTKEGRRKFQEVHFEKLQITRPSHWDKKWRVVVFDIPDKSHKRARDVLRGKLKQWEFYQLQKSVWVCPWPCEDELQLVAEIYKITPYINIMVVEKILADSSLRKHFNL
jgi:CRISPR-associated endonuclease Cas2